MPPPVLPCHLVTTPPPLRPRLPPPTQRLFNPTPPSPPLPAPTFFDPHARFRAIGVGSAASQRDRVRRNIGPAAAQPLNPTNPCSYDAHSAPLAPIFATIGDVIDLGVPDGTLDKDYLSWRR
jgi:hypothetical protein